MISEAILIPKIYARLQEIASNFSKFSGEAPLSKIPESARHTAQLLVPVTPKYAVEVLLLGRPLITGVSLPLNVGA